MAKGAQITAEMQLNRKLDALKTAVESIAEYLQMWQADMRWKTIEDLRVVWDKESIVDD